MAKLISLFVVAIVVLATIIDITQGAANVIDINKRVLFEYSVIKNPKPVVVYFYSTSACPACKWSIKPMLEKMAKRRSNNLLLATVDFDKVPELEAEEGIRTLPTTRVYYKGEVIDQVEGLLWSDLVPLVNSAAKLVKVRRY